MIVGWKRFDFMKQRYKQVKDSLGGNKIIELKKSDKYSYDKLLNLALEAMKNDDNIKIFNNSSVKLGNYKDEIYPNFTDFWNFAKQIKANNREIRVY